MIIEKIEDRDGTISFEDRETEDKYSRIVGGLGWPGIRPGFIVVVAEEFFEDPSLRIRHARVLAEIEDESLEILFQKCLELKGRYKVEHFYANSGDKPMMEFWYDYNGDFKHGSSLWLQLAPFPEDFSYHVRVIRERLKRDKKSLQFGEKSILPGYLMELSTEEVMKASVYDHPSIAALGYAVSYLKSYPFRKKSRPRRRPTSWKTI